MYLQMIPSMQNQKSKPNVHPNAADAKTRMIPSSARAGDAPALLGRVVFQHNLGY
jgi:hypothetical protein